ncbi:MAG: hypothetical protein GY757_49430, partial [bacterium]|nr:hypothetical protein [bacterium]
MRTKNVALVIVVGILILAGTSPLNAFMAGNESEGAFGGNDKKGKSLYSSGPTLEYLIVEGGGYFFQSSAAFHQLLSQYELS